MSGEKLWKVIQETQAGPGASSSPEVPRTGMSRRGFIELVGFSVAATVFNSCKAPEQRIVPYVSQPVELTPGVANWYASTCGGCSAGCGVLIKVRDGRPIKLEGNPDDPRTGGGLCAVAHAMVFDLYDSERLQRAFCGATPVSWDEVDREISQKLADALGLGVRLLTGPLSGPATRAVVEAFLARYPNSKHVVYQPVSDSAIRNSHARTHGAALQPQYRLEQARLIVSFGADFLGTWLSPVEFTRGYAAARRVHETGAAFRHVQVESRMTLSGSNADRRLAVSPAEEIEALLLLAERVSALKGEGAELNWGRLESVSPRVRDAVEGIAREIVRLNGRSLVLCGANDPDIQHVANFINHVAGSYGTTIELRPAPGLPSDDSGMRELLEEMKGGSVGALIVWGANPAYDFHAREELETAMARVPLRISLNPRRDETSAFMNYLCPRHHFLESWADAEPQPGVFKLTQPALAPLFDTRAAQESLMRWSGDARTFYDALREHWSNTLFRTQSRHTSFEEFWDESLQKGVFTPDAPAPRVPVFATDLNPTIERLTARAARMRGCVGISLHPGFALRDGTHSSNPWLHELPDPITKITWDNYASISPGVAAKLGIGEGSILRLRGGSDVIEIPAHIQAGQHDDCVAVALGYGRTSGGKAGTRVGVNAYPLVTTSDGCFQYFAFDAALEKTTDVVEFAKTQVQDTTAGRAIVREFKPDEPGPAREQESGSYGHHALYPAHQYTEHKWAMAVDLNACTGCSACILSCQAENNIPVVGKDEVRRRREMHWLRVDRYYQEAGGETSAAFQPVMCGQCDNASCESVCPVLATVHSSEGLNIQVYNRCVGTRYCENNCALKARRFNWFEYPHQDPVANLALNPDVTVRSRGVMEKCTFCVQRIQEAKIRARNEGRPIRDGEIQTACQQSCPAQAITFGDLVQHGGAVARAKENRRGYVLLEELNLGSAVNYLGRVRHTEEVEA